MIKRIIFDLDNTLIMWKDEYWKALEDTFTFFEIDVSLLELLNIEKKIDHYEDSYDNYNKKDMQTLIESGFKRIITLPSNFVDVWEENLGSCAEKAEESLKKTLEYLNTKYDLVILTNWFRKSAISRLKKAEIFPYFKEIYSGESVRKPNKEAFLIACDEHFKEECIMVGDNFINDIKPAIELGIKAIYYTQIPSKECICIKKIEELREIL